MKRQRLDRTLVARKLAATRSRAADAIRRGHVRVNGETIAKPGALVDPEVRIEVDDPALAYVGRGALKLRAAIEAVPALGRAIENARCLDIGASTGGFTQVLLEYRAAEVVAVDVGRNQLHPRLRADARVTVLEETDARGLGARLPGPPVGVIVADVSFISLKKALPAALALATADAWLAALVKPQFEVGPSHVGRGGIVRDESIRERALIDVADWLAERGWPPQCTLPSPICGGDGNLEYLIVARRRPETRKDENA